MKGNGLIAKKAITVLRRRSDGRTLDLDFTQGVLDSRITFSRASTATFINSSGLVASASTNVARFDHDPATLQPKGLLIEGSATNICTYSQDFSNAAWTLDNGSAVDPSVSSVSQSAPDGSASVNRITFNKTGGTFSRIRQALTGTASATYTLSVWMKANTANGGAATQNVGLRIGVDAAGFNCVVTTTWKRFQYSYALSGTNADAQIMLWDNIVGNDETADVLVWGAQLETGSGASSYIPTGASQATRAVDNCSMPTTSFITGTLYPQTLFVDCIPASPSGGFLNLVRLFNRTGGGTFSYGNEMYFYSATTMSVNRKITATSNADRSLVTGLAYNTQHKFATSIDSSAFLGSYDGLTATGVTTAPSALPTVVTHLGIGCNGDASPLGVMFGTIRRITFWPFAMNQTQLNAVTTL